MKAATYRLLYSDTRTGNNRAFYQILGSTVSLDILGFSVMFLYATAMMAQAFRQTIGTYTLTCDVLLTLVFFYRACTAYACSVTYRYAIRYLQLHLASLSGVCKTTTAAI